MEKGHHSSVIHPNINDPNVFVFYRYDPSVIAASVSTVCFCISTAVHIFQAGKSRTFYFIPFIVGGIFDTFGYIVRSQAHYHQWSVNIFIAQQLLILLAPALFAASIYLTLDRIILLTEGEMLVPIPARWLTRIFVCGDVLSFVVQSAGGGLMATKNMILGQHLVVLALVMQITSFGFFLITGGIFHFRIVRKPTPASHGVNWQKYMYTLYAAGILIFTRSVFRAVEFSLGNDGFLMRHEIFMYIFEGLLMLGVMVSFNIIHPDHLVSRRSLAQIIMLGTRGTHKGDSTTSLHGSGGYDREVDTGWQLSVLSNVWAVGQSISLISALMQDYCSEQQ